MTRYYKFLIVNVLVFFCIGTAALQSFLVSFKSVAGQQLIQVIANSFPTAGPFYVGWRKCIRLIHILQSQRTHLPAVIFTMGIHGGLELALCKYSSFNDSSPISADTALQLVYAALHMFRETVLTLIFSFL